MVGNSIGAVACFPSASDRLLHRGCSSPLRSLLFRSTKTDLLRDILDSRADSFNGRFDFIFWHAKSFRPIPQLMIRTDVDTRWLGRPSLLCHLIYQLRQSKEAAPMCCGTDTTSHHMLRGRAACDNCLRRRSRCGFATMEKLFRSAI